MYEEHGNGVTVLLSCLSIVALSLNDLPVQNFFKHSYLYTRLPGNLSTVVSSQVANHYLFGALLQKSFCAVWFLMLFEQRF